MLVAAFRQDDRRVQVRGEQQPVVVLDMAHLDPESPECGR